MLLQMCASMMLHFRASAGKNQGAAHAIDVCALYDAVAAVCADASRGMH